MRTLHADLSDASGKAAESTMTPNARDNPPRSGRVD